MTVPKGASFQDPAGLFDASLDVNARRAIDFHEDDRVDESAREELICAAAAANGSAAKHRK